MWRIQSTKINGHQKRNVASGIVIYEYPRMDIYFTRLTF